MGLSSITAMLLLIFTENIIECISKMPLWGWILVISTGVSISISSISSLLAMKSASVVLSSLFGTAGLLVPCIAGISLFNQPITLGQWFGMLLLFIASVLLVSSSQKTNGKLTFKTFLLLILYTLFNGTTMLLQTLYKTYVPNGNVSLYSFLQFALPSVILFVTVFLCKRKECGERLKISNKLLGFTVFAAAALFGISQISTVASAEIPVAILFPISDGGGMIISAIVAAVIFKERFTVKSIFGIIIGVTGIIMIKLLV